MTQAAHADEAVALAKALGQFLNHGLCADKAAFVEALALEHRTIQQLATRLFLQWFSHLATLPPERYDARLRASVELAKQITALTGLDPRLPLI